MKKQTGCRAPRVKVRVNLEAARDRLTAYRIASGSGPHKAAQLAGVIWPDAFWRSNQGAGAAASRILKRLGYRWSVVGYGMTKNWGWFL